MENKAVGRRVRMTKLLLKDSLIEIMKEKSIHEVSIKEICEGADINRSTFYRHYDTQYDLYDEIIDDIAEDMGGLYKNGYSTVEFLTKVLEYIESKRETFLVILSENGKVSLGEAYSIFTSRFINYDNMDELGTYVAEFIAAGFTSTVWSWLNKEKRRSPRLVARVLYSIMMNGLGKFINLADIMIEKNKE